MATNGAHESVSAWSDEQRREFGSYFMSRGGNQSQSERQIHRQGIDIPNVNFVSYTLENTKRESVNLKIDTIEQRQALSILFSVYKNKGIHSKQLEFGKFVEVLDNVDSGDPEVIYANSLKVVIDALSEQEAQQLAELISTSTFKCLELAINKISDESTMALLNIIANKNIPNINIKIPSFNVNNIDALKGYLASLQAPQQTELMGSLSQLMRNVRLDLNEVSTAASAAYEGVKQKSTTFLNAYVRPALAFLTEDEPAPEQLAPAVAEPDGRQTPNRKLN